MSCSKHAKRTCQRLCEILVSHFTSGYLHQKTPSIIIIHDHKHSTENLLVGQGHADRLAGGDSPGAGGGLVGGAAAVGGAGGDGGKVGSRAVCHS